MRERKKKINQFIFKSINFFRSIPELDPNLFPVDFHIKNEDDARSLFGLSKEQSIAKTKDDWIRQLNEIYCQSISLECEYIEVNYLSMDNLISKMNI